MNFSKQQQESFVRLAMEQAEMSIESGCSPFGVVLVDREGKVLVAARNTVTPETDITQHAEMNLLRVAAEKLGLQKFPECAVFINAASCSMCASALIQAGVRNFYYGAPFEPHTNPAVSYIQLSQYCKEPLNIYEGILGDECKAQIERGRKGK